ncbi:Nrap protein [Pisolithus marmoratus]|nr:Nrap protein [Pisolithus marmoratus]
MEDEEPEDSGGDEEESMDGIEPTPEDPDTSSHNAKKPPTGEELRMIKDAVNLYQSSSFKLQIDALLPNVRPSMKDSRKAPLERFLHSLRSCLISMRAVEPQNPVFAARALAKQGIAVPFALPHPTEDAKWKVRFEPPSDVNVVGSWANQICVKRKDGAPFTVDVTVEMPDTLFQEKDYLDSRYFHKRSLYLAIVAQNLSTSLEVDVFYRSALGDPRLTMLVLSPRKGSQNDFSKAHADIHVIPTISSSNPIPLSRLSPSHANVRLPGKSSAGPQPTPIYNTNVLLATYPKLSLLATNALKRLSPAFSDAYALLRVWANQRGYGEGPICVRGFEGKGCWWNEVLGLVILGEEPTNANKVNVRKPLGKGLSSYQLFRGALDVLARQDFSQRAVYVKSTNGHKYSPEEYTSHHSAVFVDSTSTLNFLADVPSASLSMLRYDANETLGKLNTSSESDNIFAQLFLNDQIQLSKRCDATVRQAMVHFFRQRLTFCRVDLVRASKKQSAYEFVEYGSSDNALQAAISKTLQRGLGDRVQAIGIFHPSSKMRSVSDAHNPLLSTIYIGLIYNSENAFRLVDHGPPAEEQDSEAGRLFRQLWGDKAELRRFKDGRIIESVVWEVKTSDDRAFIPVAIVRHLLHYHFGIPVNDIRSPQNYFDAKLRLPDEVSKIFQASGSPSGFKSALVAFDGLVKSLKSLGDEIPLVLSSVSPTSEYLRYTSALGPVPIPRSAYLALPDSYHYLPTIDFNLEFERSTKWPDDIHAVQKVKLALLEAIATALLSSNKIIRANVCTTDCSESTVHQGPSLEIYTAEGWAFCTRIWYDREATLLERLSSSTRTPSRPLASTVPNPREQREAQHALEIHTRRFIHAPRHHRAAANLAHRFPAYSGTVRLVKRWLAAHWLLATHVSAEAVEIISARPFLVSGAVLSDNASSIPNSKERGFALVLQFLRDWKPEEPIFVPMYEDSTPSSKPAVVAVSSKHGVWTISTSKDESGRMWTSNGPDVIAARRIRAIAKEACKILHSPDTDSLDAEVRFPLSWDFVFTTFQRLFCHATDDYDVLIELNPMVLPRYHQSINTDLSAWSKDRANLQDDATPRPGFDPAWLLFQDLQATYSDTFKFFYDVYGGRYIGAIWLPIVSGVRPFRVMGGFSCTPMQKSSEKNKGTVVLNKQAVLDEIERLGVGLIKKVEVRERS